MHFNEIIHGTQYYRTPTPLPEEWAGDIANMEGYGIDTFQIRINWRWNERVEGVYDFSDVDRLMELAKKHGKKVVIKFLLECAPQYVFDKYGGSRIGPRGEVLRGGSHGAFFGGWRPCFTNPDVQRRASLFVEEVAKRYKDHPSLILWNSWNEIRNKPFEDCFCPHCRRAYGEFLRKKHGTIEALNSFYGTAEESFENIALPATPHGFWDMLEFKKFKGGENLYEYLKFVYDAIKKHDTAHPVMAHVGFTSAFQYSIGDVCDDYTVKRAVDFWGTSIPCDTTMETEEQRLDFMLLNDYLRSLDKNYFLHEIYPGLGMFKYSYDTPFDLRFKLYTALSSGAKGLVYWQYRAERVGHEADCAGLLRADGSPREVAYTVRDFDKELKRDMKYWLDGEAKHGDIAIVFDFNSLLLSEFEDVCGADFRFDESKPLHYYLKSHSGMYRHFKRCNYNVDYVGATEPEKWGEYKVLYFPYYNMLDPDIAPHLEKFVKEGGTVIADEGFGLREMNTWMQPYDMPLGGIATARLRERRRGCATLPFEGEELTLTPYYSEIAVKDAEVLVRFSDGTPAIQEKKHGKGRIIFSGVALGYTAFEDTACRLFGLVDSLLSNSGVEKEKLSDFKGGVFVKRLCTDEYETVFLFNCSEGALSVPLEGEALSVGGDVKLAGKSAVLDKDGMGYYVMKRRA